LAQELVLTKQHGDAMQQVADWPGRLNLGNFFDYRAPAELFLAKPAKRGREKYRRFATAAEALRYAIEDLRTPKAFGAWLEVGDERFNSGEIQRLYEAEDYPLRKPE
jgi:hypothetical protein